MRPATSLMGIKGHKMTIYLVGDSWVAMNTYQNYGALIVAESGSSSQYWSDYLDNFTRDGGRLSSDDTVILNAGAVDFLNHTPRETTYNNLKNIAQVLSDQGVHLELVGAPNVSSISELPGPIQMDPLYSRIASEVLNTFVSTAMMDTIKNPAYLDASGFHLNELGYSKYNQVLQNDFFVNVAYQGINKNKLSPIIYDNHQMVLDGQHAKVIISEEPYWNSQSITDISSYVPIAHSYRLEGGVAITPNSWDKYGGTATTEQLVKLVHDADFVVIDPCVGTGLTEQQLLEFSDMVSDYVHSQGKEIYAALTTYANPSLVQDTINFNNALLSTISFDGVYYVSAKDFYVIPDSWELNLVGVANGHTVPGMF